MIVLKFVLLVFLISTSYCRLPDKVKCVNENCSKPISKAKTLINYNSGDPDLMSFPANSDAVIYMKSAGLNPDIWYATINGQSGFVNSQFLREYKKIAQPEFELPIEGDSNQVDVKPDKVQQAHEVVEGTTIFTMEPVSEVQQSIPTLPPIVSTEETVPSLQDDKQNQDSAQGNNNENTPVQTNIENFLNENLLNLTPADQTSEIPEQVNLPDEVNQTNSSEDQNTDINNQPTEDIQNNPQGDNNIVDENAQLLREPTISEDSAVPSSDSPTVDTSKTTAETPSALQTESVSDSENASTESPEVPDKVDFVNPDLPKSDHSDMSQQNLVLSPNLIDTIEAAQQPVDNSNIINNVVNDNTVIAPKQPEDTPQVPETVSENTILVSEENKSNNILNINSEVGTDQLNIQSETTPSPIVEEQSTTVNSYPDINQINFFPGVSTETIPEKFTTDIPTIDDTEILNDQSVPIDVIAPTIEAQSTEKNTYTTEQTLPTPETIPASTTEYYSEVTSSPLESDSYTTSTESLIEEIFNTPKTEAANVEENNENIISSIYTTIADMWPPATEAPPSEPIFNPELVQEPVIDETESGSFSFVKYLFYTYNSVMGTKEQSNALFPSAGDTCFTDEYCDGESLNKPNRLLTFLLTTAGSVILFILGYYYIESKRQDSRLIGNINNLQRELLFSTKECEILKEELASTKSKLAGIEDSSFGMDDMVQSLKAEIQELKENNERLRNSLDDNEKLLRVSENTAGELQNTLGEVENTLSELLAERAHSEEQIAEFNGKIQAFEEELISVSRERDNFQLKYVSAETALEEFKNQKKELEELNRNLIDAQNKIELQKHEIAALKDAIKELKSGGSSNTDVTSFIDHTEIKAKLSKALEEKNSFMTKYETEHKERSRLAEELSTIQESYKTSRQQTSEALTRLEVLGKYFQERESELMKELSTKEAIWLSKQGESASTVEKIELLQQEVQRYKEKCDALTRELAEQESARRTAVSEVEARAHAAWLEARAARRDADAARDDAAALRRKLNATHRADGAVSPHAPHSQLASPLEAELPAALPPPLAFLPPLLPPLPRPPPLGRLPSPHPPRYSERRYSPDSRYSPESRYSPVRRYSPEPSRYSPESRYSPRPSRSPYSPRRRRSVDRYNGRGSRSRNPPDTETEYNSDSPTRRQRPRRYSRHSGPSSGSGCSSESEKGI